MMLAGCRILKYFAAGSLGALFLALFLTNPWSSPGPQQPIAFDHKKHAQRHVTCDVCHPLYENYPRAGIPGVKICILCHEEVIYRIPEKDKIQKYRESGHEIPWSRVYLIEPDIYGLDRLSYGIPSKVLEHVYGGTNPIYFSHRRHTGIGKVECRQCHGDVADMEKPITEPAVKIEMNQCISCHKAQEKKVSVDCADCHR